MIMMYSVSTTSCCACYQHRLMLAEGLTRLTTVLSGDNLTLIAPRSTAEPCQWFRICIICAQVSRCLKIKLELGPSMLLTGRLSLTARVRVSTSSESEFRPPLALFTCNFK
jgi:hypothetical protein